MKGPESIINAAIAFTLLVSGCSPDKKLPSSPAQVRTETPISELTPPSDKLLLTGVEYKIGVNISVLLLTNSYEVMLNPRQLLKIAGKCGLGNQTMPIEILIADKVFKPERIGQIVIGLNGSPLDVNSSLAATLCAVINPDNTQGAYNLANQYKQELKTGKEGLILIFTPKKMHSI